MHTAKWFQVLLWQISIWLIDGTLSGATTSGQIGQGSSGNEGVLHIPQSFRTGASPSDGLVSYPGHSLGESYPSTEMQLVYSAAPANWTVKDEGTVDHSTVTRWFKKFYLGCKNYDDQGRSGRIKTMDSEALPQAIEANPEYQLSLESHRPMWFVTSMTLAKTSGPAELCLMLPKYWLTLILIYLLYIGNETFLYNVKWLKKCYINTLYKTKLVYKIHTNISFFLYTISKDDIGSSNRYILFYH